MSEPKRVNFTTLSSSVSSVGFGGGAGAGGGGGGGALLSGNIGAMSAPPSRFGTDFMTSQQAKSDGRGAAAGAGNGKQPNKTMRLTMELFPTDSCSYPEFNYSKLLHLEKKKMKKLKLKTNGFSSDPFNDNDDDVARIAKELERKYGSAYGSGRGSSRKDDHCDIGLGYDESDSFIDNTEAYDEIIPAEVETIEGGFYINCGALEFKKLHTEPLKTRTDEIIKMPNRVRKRVLSSSSSSGDSSSSEDGDNDDADSDAEASSVEATNTKTTKDPSTQPAEKRPKSNTATSTSVTTAAKKPPSQPPSQDHDNSNSNSKKKKKLTAGVSSSSNSPKPPSSVGSDSEKERARQKTVKTTTVKDMLKAKRDSFLKMQEGGSGGTGSSGAGNDAKAVNGEVKASSSKSSDEETSSSDDSDDASELEGAVLSEKKPKTSSNAEDKNEKLRSADTTLPEIDSEVISSVHNFKEMVKSRSLIGKRFLFDDGLTQEFLKIDEALLCVEKAQRNMVFAHLEYHLQLPKYYFLRKAKDLRVREEKLKSKRALGKLRKAVIEAMPGAITNFEVELRKHAELQAAIVNSDHPPKMPKKKFPWNNNLRNLLYEVYQVRWTSYPVLGTRKETLEDFISVYMKQKVVELWPSGWMRYEELQREIEKRKSAAKKAKDKKKEKEIVNSAGNIATTTAQSTSSAPAAVPTAATIPGSSSFIKQFEDFATGSRSSCANSDTESVASSSASSGLKRKNSDAAGARGKAPKTHNSNEGSKKSQLLPGSTTVELVSSSPNRNAQDIVPATSTAASNGANSLAQAIASGGDPQSTSQAKHSKVNDQQPNIRVIDLDNYRTPSDILQTATSQRLLSNSDTVTITTTMANAAYRRDSSSESDGVEFVGVYPAKACGYSAPAAVGKNKSKKTKTTTTTTTMPIMRDYNVDANTAALYASAASIMAGGNHNNNNTNANNNNSKKTQNGANTKATGEQMPSSTSEFDALQVVRTLKELGDLQQSQLMSSQNASKKDQNAQ